MERRLQEAIEAERFARLTLDALDSGIAVLDERGVILTVNRAWREFAASNGMPAGTDLVGENYLTVCDVARGPDKADACAAAAGIRSVLRGERPAFTLEYPCHSPAEKRWFILRATTFPGEGPARVVAAHINITQRRLAEERAIEYQKRLRRLTSELMLSEERQRRQLAIELHDGLAQDAVVALQTIRRYRGSLPPEIDASQLELAESLLTKAVQQIQATVFSLSPTVLYDLGLPAALKTLCRQMRQMHGIECECRCDGKAEGLARDLEVLLFQVARELLTNVGRHASATRAIISLDAEGDPIVLGVEDDGVGFQPGTLRVSEGGHFGLLSVRERIEFAGGRVDIQSKPGDGTRIFVSVPRMPREA